MTTRDKLEYQKRLRFLREARAKTASEQLKLAKAAEESDLTKRVVTLGDKENRVPARGETPKAYNEVPKTRETSRVKDPLEAGDKGDNALHIDLDDVDYAKISEQKRFYVKRVGSEERNEPYSGPEIEELDIEPQFYSDEAEAGTVADMLIDLDPHGMEDFYVANLEDEPLDMEDHEETMSDEEFEEMLKEATPPQEDADQSLSRFKKRKKAVRTRKLKRKSHAKLNESNLSALLRECGCQMQSPFDAPEDEPQGYMLKQSLEKIGSQATDLSNLANHDDDPEPWVEFKVTSAAEQIDAVHDYIKYGRKHRSDMSGHEDMHSHDEMMNEKILRKVIRKLLEQAGSTLISEPPAPVAAPAATTPPIATPERVQRAVQACKSLFDPNTPRSLINHLTRLLRGLQTRNPTIANYELNSHNAHMHLTFNVRALDVVFVYQGIPGRSDNEATRLYFDSEFGRRYNAALSGIRDALYIPGVNRIRTDSEGERYPTLLDWPRDITRINPRLMADMIARLQRAITIINAENSTTPNICDLISQIPTGSSTPSTGATTTTAPASEPAAAGPAASVETINATNPDTNSTGELTRRLTEKILRNFLAKKKILKEQAIDTTPTEFDYAMGMGATGFASPDANVPAAPTAAPTVSAPIAASRGRRAPVTDAIQACNLIFNEQTPRSFAMHLKRLKRGIEQNNATIADYELRANNAYVTFVTNRYMPVILAANASLSSQIETVRNAIRQFNTPALPQQLSQITNRRAVISKITTLQNVLSSNANICDSLRNAPPEVTPTTPTTPTPPRPETSPEVSSENVQSVVNREKTFIYNMPNNVFAPIIVRALERVNSGEITPDAIRAYAANPNMLGPDVESAVVELRRHINNIENAATQPPISEENITYARNALQELYNWSQQNIVRTRRTAPAGFRGGGVGDWIAAALTVGEESPLRLRPYVQGLISTRIYTAMGNSLTEAIARLDSAARGETITPEYSTSGPVLTPSFITPSDTARSAPIVASTPASTAAGRLAGRARSLYRPPTS